MCLFEKRRAEQRYKYIKKVVTNTWGCQWLLLFLKEIASLFIVIEVLWKIGFQAKLLFERVKG